MQILIHLAEVKNSTEFEAVTRSTLSRIIFYCQIPENFAN